ncbi:unnamed protein product [Brassicogethes aeneus]|uniref:Uncharacterized protein n=1 Tax=Brassicogethes aeneus TaxID=1431903 RepID=A0A9P0FDF4_BRAAE|nr:unnamed protein product [Brassicogethes aeneus]
MASVVENKKICKHCKKKVVLWLDCVNCGTSFYRSCEIQAKVTDKTEKVICCKQEKSEVITEKEATMELDEKRLKMILESHLNKYFTPIKKSIDTEIMEFKKSVQYISDAFEEQKAATEEAIDEIKRLNEENVLLKSKINVLEVSTQEQKEKQNNLIVAGIPKQKEENTTK